MQFYTGKSILVPKVFILYLYTETWNVRDSFFSSFYSIFYTLSNVVWTLFELQSIWSSNKVSVRNKSDFCQKCTFDNFWFCFIEHWKRDIYAKDFYIKWNRHKKKPFKIFHFWKKVTTVELINTIHFHTVDSGSLKLIDIFALDSCFKYHYIANFLKIVRYLCLSSSGKTDNLKQFRSKTSFSPVFLDLSYACCFSRNVSLVHVTEVKVVNKR